MRIFYSKYITSSICILRDSMQTPFQILQQNYCNLKVADAELTLIFLISKIVLIRQNIALTYRIYIWQGCKCSFNVQRSYSIGTTISLLEYKFSYYWTRILTLIGYPLYVYLNIRPRVAHQYFTFLSILEVRDIR